MARSGSDDRLNQHHNTAINITIQLGAIAPETPMLFLVISTPRPEKPTSMASTRHSYWDWMNPLLESGLAKSVHARVGRGAVALFDVDSTETLHRLMNEWGDIVPAHMDVYPLLDQDTAKKFLQTQMT